MTGPYRAPRGQTTHCCLPGDVPAELSKVTASASHPDLLGGWDAWAEAAAPTPAAEGRTLALEAGSPQGAHRAWHFAPLHCQAALDPPERGEGREQQQVPVPAPAPAAPACTGVACSSVSPRTPLPRLPCTGRRPATSCRRPHPALPSEGLLGDWGGPQGLCCGGISGRHPGFGGTELCRASLCGRLPFPCIVTLPWWEVSTSELLSGGRVDRRPLQGPFVRLSARGSSEASFLTKVEVGW